LALGQRTYSSMERRLRMHSINAATLAPRQMTLAFRQVYSFSPYSLVQQRQLMSELVAGCPSHIAPFPVKFRPRNLLCNSHDHCLSSPCPIAASFLLFVSLPWSTIVLYCVLSIFLLFALSIHRNIDFLLVSAWYSCAVVSYCALSILLFADLIRGNIDFPFVSA